MSKPTYVQDYQAISEVLKKYIEGCKQAKSSIMKSAFSPQAAMYSVGPDGKLTGGAIPILFEGVDKGFRPSPGRWPMDGGQQDFPNPRGALTSHKAGCAAMTASARWRSRRWGASTWRACFRPSTRCELIG